MTNRSLRRLPAVAAPTALAIALGVTGVMAPAMAPAIADDDIDFSDQPIPIDPETLPARTPPLLEIGEDFLGTGFLADGIEMPGGAVWQPALWVFGDFRTAYNYVEFGDDGTEELSEWVNRLDLFANLKLTGTERLLIGVSPLHSKGNFTGYRVQPTNGFATEANGDITTLFFEGDIGEMVPDIDPGDRWPLDWGFSVGRQPITFQQGIMVNDTMDAVALTRDTIILPGAVDTRATLLAAWNGVNRGDNRTDSDARAYGLFLESDIGNSTVAVDLAYVDADNDRGGGDGVYVGASSTQRIGMVNLTGSVNTSVAVEDEGTAVGDGTVVLVQLSHTPGLSNDLVYANAFWGIDDYSSAARAETAGGPLGQVGILFAATGLGGYPAAIDNQASHRAGGAVGYQLLLNNEKTQLVGEIGGVIGTASVVRDAVAVGARFQHSFGGRYILQMDTFGRARDETGLGAGIRSEFRIQF